MGAVSKVKSLGFRKSINAIFPPSNYVKGDASKCDDLKATTNDCVIYGANKLNRDISEWNTSQVSSAHVRLYLLADNLNK